MQTTVLTVTADNRKKIRTTLTGGGCLDITVTEATDEETPAFLPPGTRTFFPEGWPPEP